MWGKDNASIIIFQSPNKEKASPSTNWEFLMNFKIWNKHKAENAIEPEDDKEDWPNDLRLITTDVYW